MNNNYKKWSNIRDDFQDFILEVLGVKRSVDHFFIDNYSIIQEGQYKIYDLYSNGTNPLCLFTSSPAVIWHVPIDWNNSCKIKIVTEYNEDESDVVIENRSINDLIADDWVVIQTLYAADSSKRRYLINIEVKSIELSIHAYWNNIKSKPTNIEYTTYKLKSAETIGNFATSTTKYPTTKAVYDFVTSSLQSYVPDVSGKEDKSNKVTAWSTEIPEGETDPVITPSNTKYPSEKLVYDTFQTIHTAIPDDLADLNEDTTHRVVTDAEKTTWNGKQDSLVSGTNIKTINNESILGSGNISISGGYIQTVVSGANITQALSPNVFYSFGTVISLTATLDTPMSGVSNEYSFEFDSGSTATTLSIPASVVGIDATTIKANKHYEVSIKYDTSNQNYYGLIQEW